MAKKRKLDVNRAWKSAIKHPALKRVRRADAHVRVGVLSNGAHGGDGISVVELAAIHEFGAPAAGIPERSFIRRTFNDRQSDLERVIGNLARKVVADELTMEQALNQLGALSVAWIRNTVTEHRVDPKSTAETDARKNARAGKPAGSPTTTLVDTGRMIGALTWAVELGRAAKVES